MADAWDVMTSERPYRSPCSQEEALEECLRHRGGQFDPGVVDALERLLAAGALSPEVVPEPAAG